MELQAILIACFAAVVWINCFDWLQSRIERTPKRRLRTEAVPGQAGPRWPTAIARELSDADWDLMFEVIQENDPLPPDVFAADESSSPSRQVGSP
jgi:hypothetical protein